MLEYKETTSLFERKKENNFTVVAQITRHSEKNLSSYWMKIEKLELLANIEDLSKNLMR